VKLGHKTSSPDTQSLKLQVLAENYFCLGSKYFLTSTSTWHASTSTSTRKLYVSTDQVPLPVPRTRLDFIDE